MSNEISSHTASAQAEKSFLWKLFFLAPLPDNEAVLLGNFFIRQDIFSSNIRFSIFFSILLNNLKKEKKAWKASRYKKPDVWQIDRNKIRI